jgi:hypothetical protein
VEAELICSTGQAGVFPVLNLSLGGLAVESATALFELGDCFPATLLVQGVLALRVRVEVIRLFRGGAGLRLLELDDSTRGALLEVFGESSAASRL